MDSPKNIIGPINLGNPTEFKVSELAELIIKKTNSKSKIVFMDLPQDDPKQRKPDIKKAKTILDWDPIIDLNVGLDKTIEYFSSKV
jgi:UDP-glucuronate decarboxylase